MERKVDWIREVTNGVLHASNNEDVHSLINGVSTDSRTIQKGNLFVPLVGEVFNGHLFITKAEKLGAKAALWQAGIPLPTLSIPLIVVKDTLLALQALATAYRKEVDCKVVAITGSNGKTTTKDLVAGVLDANFSVHKTAGNLNNHIGLPLTLLSMPAATEIVVLEMGMNNLGEIALLSKIAKPNIAIITNIGESHIGNLGSREKIAEAKLEICEGMESNGDLLIDGDEPLLYEAKVAQQMVTIGWDRDKCYEVPINVKMLEPEGWSFTSLQTSYPYMVPLLGRHNIKNALFAIEAGRRLGLSEDKIALGLRNVATTSMRLEVVKAKNGMKIINDAYNASPASMYAALHILYEIEPNREKWALLAGMEELGDQEKDYHQQLGTYVVQMGISKLITIGKKGFYIYEGAARQDGSQQIDIIHKDSVEEATDYLQKVGNEHILLLVKASRKAGLERIVKQLVEERRLVDNIDIRIILIPLAVAFGIGVLLGPMIIPTLQRLKFGQSIREEGPEAHLKKAGTPTMGGSIILMAVVLTALPFSSFMLLDKSEPIVNADLFFLLFATLGYGIIGFLDDYIKVVMKRSLGLTASQKLLGQIFIGLVLFWVLIEVRVIRPGSSSYIFNVGIPGTEWDIQLNWLYLPLLLLMMIGTSNAVNLTDGLDGLLAGTAAVAYGAYAVIGMVQSNYTVAIFAISVVGALLGFLVFNAHPAKVFMGDTGSLALGGGLAALAVITKTELLLPLIGGIFVAEALSVMLQVLSFKTRGKRIFRMSPLHHHFELTGWSEWRVVTTFWSIGIFLAGVGIYLEVFLR